MKLRRYIMIVGILIAAVLGIAVLAIHFLPSLGTAEGTASEINSMNSGVSAEDAAVSVSAEDLSARESASDGTETSSGAAQAAVNSDAFSAAEKAPAEPQTAPDGDHGSDSINGSPSPASVPAASAGKEESAASIPAGPSQEKENDISGTDLTPSSIPLLGDLYSTPAGSIISGKSLDSSDIGKYFTGYEIVRDDAVFQRINGNSYRDNPDIGLEELRYLKVLHYNFDHEIQVGELIVNAELENDFLEIFQALFEAEYEICQMRLIDDYWTGDGEDSDTNSIDHDNTSAFCYRFITGSSDTLSNHAFGRAIDINPIENPYVVYHNGVGSNIHPGSADYIEDRTPDKPHCITTEDLAFQLFTEHGFSWGGLWENPKDYQHFEK